MKARENEYGSEYVREIMRDGLCEGEADILHISLCRNVYLLITKQAQDLPANDRKVNRLKELCVRGEAGKQRMGHLCACVRGIV